MNAIERLGGSQVVPNPGKRAIKVLGQAVEATFDHDLSMTVATVKTQRTLRAIADVFYCALDEEFRLAEYARGMVGDSAVKAELAARKIDLQSNLNNVFIAELGRWAR